MLYCIKMYDDQECFYKVGHSLNVERRLSELSKFYQCELICTSPFGLTGKSDIKLEYFFHKDFKHKTYKPLKTFLGDTECYTYLNKAFVYKYFRDNRHLMKFSKSFDTLHSDLIFF